MQHGSGAITLHLDEDDSPHRPNRVRDHNAREAHPIQVLDILASRLQKKADRYERVNIPGGYGVATVELRRYAKMIRTAQEYLRHESFE